MARRSYGQACSVAGALDRIGERWSMLIVRELMLGPLRFRELARAVGGAPTDVLTRRLRDLEADGIVRRVELGPPASATAYELTEIGRELEGPMLELGRWGLHFYRLEDLPALVTSTLASAIRVILQPPEGCPTITVQLRTDGYSNWLRIADGAATAGRGEAEDADLVLTGSAPDLIAAIVLGGEAERRIEMEGADEALRQIRSMVVLPERLRAEAEASTAQLLSPA